MTRSLNPSAISATLAAAVLAGMTLLSGCTPVGVVVGAGAVAGSAAMQERGFEQAVTDKATEVAIQKKVFDADSASFRRLEVSVVEGRVLLTGVVPTVDDRIRAVEACWKTDDVVEVINEILVGEDAGMVDNAYDAKIEAALDVDLTLDREVNAVNFIPDASGGTLFLMGIAQSQAELDRVIAHARNVERVRRVVSHVQIKDSPERQETLKRLAELAAEKDSGS